MKLTKPQARILQELKDKVPVRRPYGGVAENNLYRKGLIGYSFVAGWWIKPEGLQALEEHNKAGEK